MLPSEFYQKYWRIQTKNGPVRPRPLSKEEIEFMDTAHEKGFTQVYLQRHRQRNIFMDIAKIKLWNQTK